MLDKARKGITPIVAVILLVMITVTMAGAALAFMTNTIDIFQGSADDEIGKDKFDLVVKDYYCYNGTNKLMVSIKNDGEKKLDTSFADILVYSDNKIVTTEQKSEDFRGANFSLQGDYQEPMNVSLSGYTFNTDKNNYNVVIEFVVDGVEKELPNCGTRS